jgi:transcriptional regulator with XRE-family HTH domain
MNTNMTISPYYSASSVISAESTKAYKSRKAVKVVVPLLLSFTAGTGGAMTARSTEVLDRWTYAPHIHVERPVRKNVDTRSPAEHVANIRDVFAINMSDLASVLGVTRPTAYTWLEGQEPKPEAVMRIQRLSHAADTFDRANIERLDKLLQRPILGGRSLLDMLKADEDLSEALVSLKAIAEKEAQTRREPKGSGKHLRSLDEVLSESSVGIY